MPDFSFRLLPDFLEKYNDVEPPFGFRDAGGNSLGEITYIRTYSRMKENENKETWQDAIERITNATYAIQKDYVKEHKLEWNDQKAQSSAKEFYDRLFNLKFTPPGRGLAQMGSDQVMGGNSASLQNCFTRETRFIAKTGVKSLGDTVGTYQEVLTESGWEKAEIRAFGKQDVQVVRLVPKQAAKTNFFLEFVVTPDHRWELENGSITESLAEGDFVAGMVADHEYSLDGFMHGLMFADGSISYTYVNGDVSHMMRLCGEKERYKSMFDKYHYQPNCDGDPVVYHRSSTNMKALPVSTDPDYIGSFIDAWLEFDGHQEGPSYVLDTTNSEAADWLIANAAYAGYSVRGVTTETADTNYGTRNHPLIRVRLAKGARAWKVSSITHLEHKEEVFCAVVPGVERFTLRGGVYTSNCAVVSTGAIERHNPGAVFEWAMLALMYGVGVGADMLGADKNIEIRAREGETQVYVVPDTREGWAESLRLLINSYLRHNNPIDFVYDQIRPKGAPLVSFGGKASGPEPLMRLHDTVEKIFEARIGKTLDSETITDIFNLVGSCVIAGSTRRSAEIMMGEYGDDKFLDLKNPEAFPERNSYDPAEPGWSWASNNSINVPVGADYEKYVDRIAVNGEPGFIWLDVAKTHGRMIDPPDDKDRRIAGFNPCCLAPDTTIMTSEGPRKISEIDGEFAAVVDGTEYLAKKPWVSGVGDIYRLTTKEGFEIELTPEHRLMASSGEWTPAQDLQPGDRVRLSAADNRPSFATVREFSYVRRGEVWDTEVEQVHAFDANGFYAHNSEQPLESQEMCTLVTVHLQNAESKEDFLRTLKFAFLYAKTVTLMPTPWTKTNSVMQRNRRIGLSLTGITDVVDSRGLPEILEWMEAGYEEVRRLDHSYSEWLCVRESNRVTTIKPEGSVSLLSGASPGIHWGPGGQFYMRAIRFGNSDPMLHLFKGAGYKVESDLVSDDTSVVYFPMKTDAHRAEDEVSIFEKIGLAAKAQHHWSDNGVSVTVSFDKEKEKDLITPALRLHEGSLKAVSFLPMSNETYPQQPYTKITEEEYNSYVGKIKKIDFNAIYDGVDNLEAEGEKYCTTDVCMI